MYYKELNLPHPLTNSSFAKLISKKSQHQYFDMVVNSIDNLINPELILSFRELGLLLDYGIVFGLLGKPGPNNKWDHQGYLHTDIIQKNNKWIEPSFAINWELTPSDAVWQWWDTCNMMPVYPKETPDNYDGTLDDYYLANSVAWGKVNNNDTSQCNCVASYSVKLNQAYACRTNVAHTVTYSSSVKRLALSLRFVQAETLDWDQALKILQSVIKTD